jgi:hypothetical protein
MKIQKDMQDFILHRPAQRRVMGIKTYWWISGIKL